MSAAVAAGTVALVAQEAQPLGAFTPFAYTACLLFSLFGMLMLDWRHRLFWFADARRAAIVHVVGVAAFLLWDAGGIALGVFFRGETPYMTGVLLAPELPVEELLFLIFLCWLTMNVYTGAVRLLERRRERA
ncbi:lycopene cyclase domain-containing protein [Brevibacterium senegalense]|uniref:lycopene cyclase domain-containing protein n=1 Tax=Brevibacterium senegalense TaxID=1033736 RepID=UPI000A06DE3F|nr:lycopene cyclase domain-containing protein [Brevibacterium senegalense]